MSTRTTGLLLIGLCTAACGDDGGSNSSVDAGMNLVDAPSTAPTVMISPSDGQKGVLVSQPLILTFSEPMNTASVEAAWSSTSLPAADMVFSWNTAKTILSVDASAVLEYPVGGLTVDLMGYTITLDASAAAERGEAIASAITSSFDTARDITVQIPATLTVGEGTGSTDGTGSTVVLRVGDTDTNGTWHAFVTFPLTSLPVDADIVQWTFASLYVRQDSVSGTPYTDLGSVTAGAVTPITAIDAAAMTATARHSVSLSTSADIGDPDGDRAANVLPAVDEDHAAARGKTTLRLEFGTAQDLENDEDAAIFENPRLDVRFLAR